MTNLILLICVASTWFMTGLIWFVQVVHYPLFDRVEEIAFSRYHSDHTRTTTYVVLIPMILELITSGLLVGRPPTGTDPGLAWAGFGLALASWALTFFLSVPAHNRLAVGFDLSTHRRLVRTNMLRVLSWSAHAVVVLIMTARTLR